MIELGYMAKRIVIRPDWLEVAGVEDVFAVSNCISGDFCDYIPFWKHNGFWFYDSPNLIVDLARKNGLELGTATLVYYTGHDHQFDAEGNGWTPYQSDAAFTTDVSRPSSATLIGYDIVTYSMQNSPECSPLSCNHVATDVRVNEHCLIDSLDYAIEQLETGLFNNSEPGPHRIIGVHRVE